MTPWRKIFGIRPRTKHSQVLLGAGFFIFFIGLSYRLVSDTSTRHRDLVIAEQWMPLSSWGYVFMGVGVIALVSARWPTIHETWGYALLTGLCAGWSGMYWAGIIFADTSLRNINPAIAWGMIAFMWWGISGLVDPKSTRVVITDESS